MCLERKMLTLYQNINHMIAWLTWKKVHNPHLEPSTICHKMNFQLFVNTSTIILKKGSFDIPSF
jgi:hypothetical protein